MKEAKRSARPSRTRRTAGTLRFTARLDGAEPDPAEGVKAEDMPGAQSSALPLPQSMEPKTQGVAEMPAVDAEDGARFADACVLPDGTVREYGGQFRKWPSVEAFHRARGWKAGALFFPACPKPRAEH